MKKCMPPTRRVRYCCSELKEQGGKDRIKIFGVRAEESSKRKGREVVMLDGSSLGRCINLIYHWTESEVWEFIGCNMIECCSLYNEGFTRLGCVGCPLGGTQKMLKEFERWPAYRRAYVKAFDRMIAERQRKGMFCQWKTGEDVMQWWTGSMQKEDEQQLLLFDVLEGGEKDGSSRE